MFATVNGVLKYDPPRGEMKRRTKFWCVLDITNDFAHYYQDLLKREKFITLNEPSWGSHMTVIRGEIPTPEYAHLWKKYQDEMFSVKYSLDIKVIPDRKKPGDFYILEAFCPELMEVRREMNLPVYDSFHITIGRTNY